MNSYEVTEYKIRFFGRSMTADDKGKKAEILLAGRGDEGGSALIGRIFFWGKEDADSRQDSLDNEGRPEGNMSITEIDSVIDMLRYEKPIFIVWDIRNNRVLLQTGQEPVGEEES